MVEETCCFVRNTQTGTHFHSAQSLRTVTKDELEPAKRASHWLHSFSQLSVGFGWREVVFVQGLWCVCSSKGVWWGVGSYARFAVLPCIVILLLFFHQLRHVLFPLLVVLLFEKQSIDKTNDFRISWLRKKIESLYANFNILCLIL